MGLVTNFDWDLGWFDFLSKDYMMGRKTGFIVQIIWGLVVVTFVVLDWMN